MPNFGQLLFLLCSAFGVLATLNGIGAHLSQLTFEDILKCRKVSIAELDMRLAPVLICLVLYRVSISVWRDDCSDQGFDLCQSTEDYS